MDQGFIQWLIAKGLSRRTIIYYKRYLLKLESILKEVSLDQEVVNAFVSAYNHAIARAFIKNYLEYKKRNDLEIPKITGRRKRSIPVVIPKAHIKLLRGFFYDNSIMYGLIFDLSYYGALRREEVMRIRLCDFNLVELRSGESDSVRLLIHGKGNRQRIVILPKDLMKALILYARIEKIGKEDRLFKVGKRTWWDHFYRACVGLGLTKVAGGKVLPLYHPHSIRHTRSTEWYSEGKDIVSIQKRLGHNNISTTRLYINPDEKEEEDLWKKEYD